MNATINVVLFKSKTLADGSHPLMIRICKNNKKKYKSLGVSILPQFWAFKKNKPKRNCPNKEAIQTLISDKIKEYSSQIVKYKLTQKDFTATRLIEKVNNHTPSNTVQDLIDSEIDRLKMNRIHKVIAIINKCLKQIGQELNIPIDLTTYRARHSFATVL